MVGFQSIVFSENHFTFEPTAIKVSNFQNV